MATYKRQWKNEWILLRSYPQFYIGMKGCCDSNTQPQPPTNILISHYLFSVDRLWMSLWSDETWPDCCRWLLYDWHNIPEESKKWAEQNYRDLQQNRFPICISRLLGSTFDDKLLCPSSKLYKRCKENEILRKEPQSEEHWIHERNGLRLGTGLVWR